MPWLFASISAFASLEQLLTTMLAAPALQHQADLVAIADIVRDLSSQRITPYTLQKLQSLRTDVAAAAWEHGEEIGAMSPSDILSRSASTTEQHLHQAPLADDVVGAARRAVCFAIDRALRECAKHLPRRSPSRIARLDRTQRSATRRGPRA